MRKTLLAAAAALMASTAVTPAARAADLSLPPVYQPDASPMVEFGSGWYLRADANGYSTSYDSKVFGTLTNVNFGATLGAGYQFNPFFRVDVTADYMTPISKYRTDIYGGSDTIVGTPWGNLDPINPVGGCPVNVSSAVPGNVITVGCTGNRWAKVNASAYLANAYVDLGHWYGLTPYLGAGVGLGYVQAQNNVFFRFYNGTPYGDGNTYCGGSTGVGGVNCFILGYPNGKGLNVTNYNVAYALMAGFSYDVSSLLKFDIGYRYLNLGSGVSSQQIRAGVRITPDG